ncbi:MAG: alpha-mannosidase [Clostridiales bacterium]|nr:MAG: alpha-mannosidase [Clostridiales bacterium]
MKKKTVHIISHSHWDREWYMPLERHKMKLLDLIDDSMELFEKDPGFQTFHLDGQTIVLDDYLEICPEKREQVEKYTKEGRFRVGPFYILQDEFLTSGEANVRNIQTGIRESERYGNLTKVGYFPDAFGNAGQMPQILKQAGMEAVAFGRGVKPVGFNNELKEGGEYESAYSEMMWESPDGSALLGILFANWYNNGMEIPTEEAEAKAYWDERLAKAEMFASTDELLFMNGCDHQPVQKNLSAAIETARRLYPDIEFKHSNFEDYIKSVKEAVETRLSTVRGELTSQETNGWYTLVNTCSAHIYLKRLNRINEVSLERMAEPLAAMALREGKSYPHDRLQYAWKILMQNHPHDSICGCSVDQVNKEMEVRFDRSTEVAKTVIEDSVSFLTDRIDTSSFEKYGEDAVPFAVFNTTGMKRSGTVTATLDVKRDYNKWIWDGHRDMKAWKFPAYRVVDAGGNPVAARIEDAGVKFGYDLPDDKFRQPYMARQAKVTLFAEDLPAMGYRTYALVPASGAEAGEDTLVRGEKRMENEYLSVAIQEDGTLNVLDKETGKNYENLCYFEDTLDAGNEYIYFCPEGNPAILTRGTKAEVKLVRDLPFAATYEIVNAMTVPVSADEQLKEEQEGVIEFMKRTCHRSAETTEIVLHTFVTLEKGSRSIKMRTEFDNTAKDHRIRVIAPTGIECTHHYADTVFEAVRRPNEHSSLWENPSKCEHQQCFTGLNDEKGGLLIANIGLYEYEILPQEKNAIAVTILRSVGEMGDWGVFPTELSQQLRHMTAEYELTFFSGDLVESGSYRGAYQFQVPVIAGQTGVHAGTLPAEKSWLDWNGEGVMFSNLKAKGQGTDWMARFVNLSGKDTMIRVRPDAAFEEIYRSNVIEEEGEAVSAAADGWYEIPIGKYGIVTIGMR